MNTNNDEALQKRVAYYSNLVNAWIQTRMEVDKTLILISSAGIGFLITLLAKKEYICAMEFTSFLAAFISFFAVIILCMLIFHRNSSYIGKIIDNSAADPNEKDSWLNFLDYAVRFCFVIAIIFTLLIGVSTGLRKFHHGKNNTVTVTEAIK